MPPSNKHPLWKIQAHFLLAKILKNFPWNKCPPPTNVLWRSIETTEDVLIVLVMFSHKQLVINSFKHCSLTVITLNGSEDLLIHLAHLIQLAKAQPTLCSKPRLVKGVILHSSDLLQRQDPSETSNLGLSHTYITKKQSYIWPWFEKNMPPRLNTPLN